MRVDLFDFDLPPERIALRPAEPRDAARMLLVEGRDRGVMSDRGVADLPTILRPGDCLVFNDTRVIPAQLEGTRGDARIGATLHKRVDLRRWIAFIRNAKRLRIGDRVEFDPGLAGTVEAREADGTILWHFETDGPLEAALERAGTMPLPRATMRSGALPSSTQACMAARPSKSSVAGPPAQWFMPGTRKVRANSAVRAVPWASLSRRW